MLRVIIMLLLLPGILILGVGIAKVYSDITMAAIAIGLGLVIIICANILDKKYLKERKRRHIQKAKQEINLILEASSWPTGKVLKTDAEKLPSIFLFCLFIIMMGPILIYNRMTSNPVNWEIILVSVCILAIAILYSFSFIPYLGKPACELSQDGIFTPRWGFIPWHQVFGICLALHLGKFGSYNYTLYFHVKNNQSILEKHWMRRMLVYLGLVRTQDNYFNISIALNYNSKCEEPQTIEMVARSLWKKATGRQYDWDPRFSDAYNEAAKHISENSANMKDGKRVRFLPDRLEDYKPSEESLKIIADELNRRESRQKREIRIVQCCLILFVILWSLLDLFL